MGLLGSEMSSKRTTDSWRVVWLYGWPAGVPSSPTFGPYVWDWIASNVRVAAPIRTGTIRFAALITAPLIRRAMYS